MKKIRNGIIGFVFGAIFCVTVNVAAETLISSEEVGYSNSKTRETTVDGALDELFSAVEINEEIDYLKQSISNLQSRIDNMYPVGSIYISETNTNPSELFGGTWERYAVGRTLLSTDGTSGQTGGSATAKLATSNLPSHTHSIPALTGTAASAGAHTHTVTANGSVTSTFTGSSVTTSSKGAHTHEFSKGGSALVVYADAASTGMPTAEGFAHGANNWFSTENKASSAIASAGAHTHTVTAKGSVTSTFTGSSATTSSKGAHTHDVTTTASTSGKTGSGSAFSVQDPYITVYMWKRTA